MARAAIDKLNDGIQVKQCLMLQIDFQSRSLRKYISHMLSNVTHLSLHTALRIPQSFASSFHICTFLSRVDELSSVHALGGNHGGVNSLESVRIFELNSS